MPTLYRKYRPSVFSDVTGQDTIVQTLQNEISNEKLAHAYLFSGPRGVGKTTLARLFAKSVSCEKRKKGNFEPCNECNACKQINSGRHMDIIEIDAASQTGVDNVRENIIENAGVLPTVLKKKIFIIDEVHMLSTSAFNALLKTLEEPPSHVIFILATTELHKLPATVISRCERFIFKKIVYEKMLARLKKICSEEKVKVEKEVLERIVRKSDGGLRDAESLLGQIISLDLKEITTEDIQMILPLSSAENILEYLQSVTDGEPAKAITLVNKLIEEGVDLNQFSFDLLELMRSALLLSVSADKNLLNTDFAEDTLKKLRKIATTMGENKIVALLDLTLKRKSEIKFAPLPQLPLELLAIEASELISSTSAPGRPEPVRIAETTAPHKITESKETKVEPITEKTETVEVVEEKSKLTQITESIKNVISTITDSTIKTQLDDIKKNWKQIVEMTAANVPSLSFILTTCKLKDLNGNTLCVSVPFEIHKDRIDTVKNRQLLEDNMQKIFSEKIRLSVIVVSETPVQEEDVSNLAAEFGGEVVG